MTKKKIFQFGRKHASRTFLVSLSLGKRLGNNSKTKYLPNASSVFYFLSETMKTVDDRRNLVFRDRTKKLKKLTSYIVKPIYFSVRSDNNLKWFCHAGIDNSLFIKIFLCIYSVYGVYVRDMLYVPCRYIINVLSYAIETHLVYDCVQIQTVPAPHVWSCISWYRTQCTVICGYIINGIRDAVACGHCCIVALG